MASIKVEPESEPPRIQPTEVYHGHCALTAAIRLRIATGGAGQSGLIRALADGFINEKVEREEHAPFGVAWLASDTSASFNYLAQGAADLSITYHAVAEGVAINQGIADRREYAWRDHWMLVGPKSNPAKLSSNDQTTIHELFAQLFQAAIETSTSNNRVRFLSRYDKSAANIKESNIWSAIGQTPWSQPYSSWYHQCVDFPFRALEIAAQLEEYTITDRGTWFAIEEWVRKKMSVYMAGGDAESDPMLNPAHLLVGTRARDKDIANEFADWLTRSDGGQEVIRTFTVNGVVLYSIAPLTSVD